MDARITAEILRQTAQAGPDSSICPTEVARALAPVWWPLLADVRRAAQRLAAEARIDILRKGRPVPPEQVKSGPVKGVIRLRLRSDPAAAHTENPEG
jgi:Protein of unknown function (DUF3253)